VHLREPRAEHDVFGDGRQAVADVAVERHATGPRIALAGEAGAERHVGVPTQNGCDEERNGLRVVLVIRVKEDDDLGALLESAHVARLLVPAVALVVSVDVYADP
jgi:hypothetical protein